mmetsp:Transcript_12246/g.18059  ORF Transcript_12246/g.18059 Transcript_12246/m.18059 type:complete len:94 (+) Transcript_12246:1-282(+)
MYRWLWLQQFGVGAAKTSNRYTVVSTAGPPGQAKGTNKRKRQSNSISPAELQRLKRKIKMHEAAIRDTMKKAGEMAGSLQGATPKIGVPGFLG